MNWKLFAVCGLVLPATCVAQPVFFDDFDGDSLLPQWGLPRPEDWEYNVSNGMLNVTDLFYPSDPMSPGNIAGMGASVAPQGDFLMDVWMGWDEEPRPQRLVVQVNSAGFILANFGFRSEPSFGPNPVIMASASGFAVQIPAPQPGIHRFTISRIGSWFEFSLDSERVTSLPDLGAVTPVDEIGFSFVGPYPDHFGALHVDRVLIVPLPSTGVCFLSIASIGLFRRNR